MTTLMLLAALLPGVPAAQETRTAMIDDFAWLSGHWRGEGFGGQVEEIWSQPLGGTMVGTFRLAKDGKVEFYEIIVLERDGDSLDIKIRMRSKDGSTRWEKLSFRSYQPPRS